MPTHGYKLSLVEEVDSAFLRVLESLNSVTSDLSAVGKVLVQNPQLLASNLLLFIFLTFKMLEMNYLPFLYLSCCPNNAEMVCKPARGPLRPPE